MNDRSRGKTASQPPVSAHPAFPVIVALWFAALFGIGSMVLPLDIFERFSVSSGLADAYAAAQPPLGATARIALAVLAALIGGAAGVFVAGRVRAANASRPGNRSAELQPSQTRFSAKRPISAHEELGEGGLDADEEMPAPRQSAPGPRRARADADDSAPSDLHAFATLPGRSANEVDEPLDLMTFEEPAAAEAPAEPDRERPFHHPSIGAAGADEAPFAQPQSFERSEQPAAEEAELPEPARAPIAERPLGDLGMVELVERFALALERHRAAAPQAQAVEQSAVEEPARVESTQTEPIPQAADELPDLDLTGPLPRSRGPFSAGFTAAYDDCADDDDAEDEQVAEQGYTSLLAMKSPLGHREPVRFDEDDEAGDDAEPVVVFPQQAARRAAPADEATARQFDAPLQHAENTAAAARHPAADPGATERALREALEKLQRMSGAA